MCLQINNRGIVVEFTPLQGRVPMLYTFSFTDMYNNAAETLLVMTPKKQQESKVTSTSRRRKCRMTLLSFAVLKNVNLLKANA